MVSDGWLLAPNTTLGADNGIGVATAVHLMTMPTSLRSPAIEFVFTISEEVALDGARALSPEALPRSVLLNFDSEALPPRFGGIERLSAFSDGEVSGEKSGRKIAGEIMEMQIPDT